MSAPRRWAARGGDTGKQRTGVSGVAGNRHLPQQRVQRIDRSSGSMTSAGPFWIAFQLHCGGGNGAVEQPAGPDFFNLHNAFVGPARIAGPHSKVSCFREPARGRRMQMKPMRHAAGNNAVAFHPQEYFVVAQCAPAAAQQGGNQSCLAGTRRRAQEHAAGFTG